MSNVIIPSSPEDRKKVVNALEEYSNSMTRIDAERDHLKAILQRLQDDFDLPKKPMRKVANAYHKQNITEVVAAADEVNDVYEALFG